jgi:hypothetical protein
LSFKKYEAQFTALAKLFRSYADRRHVERLKTSIRKKIACSPKEYEQFVRKASESITETS